MLMVVTHIWIEVFNARRKNAIQSIVNYFFEKLLK